jgi:hypothetical protein
MLQQLRSLQQQQLLVKQIAQQQQQQHRMTQAVGRRWCIGTHADIGSALTH